MGVNFTDTRFTFTTSTLLSVSSHLGPFSCSSFRPLAAIKPNTLRALCLNPLFVSLFSFPLLTANLAPSHSLAPFLSSLARLSWHWPVTRVGNFCGAPASKRTLIYWECWVRGLFRELVNMRTSFPKVYLYPRGLLKTSSNPEAQILHVRKHF